MVRIAAGWCLAVLMIFAARSAAAADPAFVGILALAAEPSTAEALRLDEATQQKLLDLIDRREGEAAELVLSSRDLPAAERATQMTAFVAESEKEGLKLLSAEQQSKLKQLRIAKAGMITLGEKETQNSIRLTVAQVAQIEQLLQERQEALTVGGEEERRITTADFERKLAGLLTPQQRLTWEGLAGLSPAEKGEPTDENQLAGAGQEMPADELTPANGQGETPDATSPTDKPLRTPDDKTTPTDPSRPLETPLVKSPTSPRADENEVEEEEPADRPLEDVKLRFNFRYAPWKTVLEWFAEQSDLSLELTTIPAGTFNYTDRRTYSPAEAIDLLNSVLLTKGYTLIRHKRMLMVINLEDGIPPNLVETISADELDARGKFELLSCLFKVENISAEDAEKEIKKLLGPQGSIVVLPKTSGLLVTETGGRLRVIRDLLQSAQAKIAPPAAKPELQEIALEHTIADEVLVVIRQLMGLPEDRNASADGTLRIAVDPLGTRLFISGDAEKIAKVKEILKLVDVPDALGDEGVPKVVETPQLEVYTIASADPDSVLKVVQTLLAGLPDVRLDIEPKSGNLVALARPSQHATIRATIEQMQRDSRQIEVIQLRTVDPQLAVLAINKLFGVGEGEAANDRGPKVDADPTSGQLLLRGTEGQIAQIRSLLEKMGETEFGGDTELAQADRGNVRMLNITGRNAREIVEQMQLVWPSVRANKIRVVSPSSAVREMRNGGRREDVSDERDDPRLNLDPSLLPGILDRFEIRPPASKPSPELKAPSKETPAVPPAQQPQNQQPEAQPAESEAGKPKAADRTERVALAKPGFYFAVDRQEIAQATETPSPAAPLPQTKPNSAVEPVAPKPAPKGDKPDGPPAEIIVAPGPHGIMIASEDLDALDEFESMVQSMANRASTGREYTVFYLKFARAEVAAELLNEILGGSSSGGGGDEGGGNLLGGLASGMLGDSGGGLVGSLLGLGGGGGGAISATGAVTIVADRRLNALVVQANPTDLDSIEQLLEVIDQEASPEDVQTVAKPRMIPVFYTSAEEIAQVVQQVYASRLAAGGGQQQQRQPSPEEFIRALRGGGGGRGGRSGGRSSQEEEQKMTIGIDRRSNSLVVSAPEPLFQEVKLLVEQLDQAGSDESETMRVVTVKSADPDLVRRAIVSITGGQVTTNSTGSATSPSSTSSRSRDTRSSSSSSTSQAPPPVDMDAVRQRIELFNMMQQGGSGGGGLREQIQGGFGRGGQTGGTRGGNFGGGNFGGGGGGGGRRGR